MMEQSDYLQTIAEISIAFAGFSGLIVALRKRPGPLTPTQKFRLQVMLWLAFGALFLAFLPEILHALSGLESLPWTVCSIVLVVYSVGFICWWVLKSRHIVRVSPEIFNWWAFTRMATGHAIIVTILLWVLFSGRIDLAPGAYLLALVWYLIHAAQQFFRMLFVQIDE